MPHRPIHHKSRGALTNPVSRFASAHAEDFDDGWQTLDLEALEVRLTVNGELVQTGFGRDVLGSPLNTFTWLANEQSRRGLGLSAGSINNTGSCTVPHEVFPGDVGCADFGPLGVVEVEFG